MLKASIALVILLFLPLTRVATSRGEGHTVSDTVSIWTVAPYYEGVIKGNVTKVSLTHRLTNTFTHKNGAKFTSSFNISEDKYRLQDRADNSKTWSNSILMMPKPGLIWNTSYSDSRVLNRIVTLSGALQDIVVNARNGNSMLRYASLNPGAARIDAHSMISVSSSEKVFKLDRRVQGDVGGGVKYSLGERVDLVGRAYYKKAFDRSKTSLQEFRGLGEVGDSLMSQAVFHLPRSAEFKVYYSRTTNTLEYIDLPRGIYFEQKLGSEDLLKETQITNQDIISMDATTYPLKNVELKMSAEHSVNMNDFSVAKKRFNKSVADIVASNLSYTYNQTLGNKVNFKAEKKDILKDLGPLSVSSYKQKQKSVSFRVIHVFDSTFSINAQAGATLSQIFYVDFDVNPRDRDQLNQFLQVRLNSQPFSKVNANVFLAVSRVDYVNIDRSLSIDNRQETTYDFRPQFTYHLSDRLEIAQNYGLNIEFTDFVFTQNENYLDRNITFSNTARAKLSQDLSVEFHYGLLLHDRGSYLQEEGASERVLRISKEDRKDQIRIKVRYAVSEHIKAVAKHEYSRRRDRVVATGRESIFPDGTIEGGLEGEYQWSTSRSLSFSLLKVNRFGRFNTTAQNDYWVMTSNFKYAF